MVIKSDTLDDSQCQSIKANQACEQHSEVCLDGPSTQNVNGLAVTKDCWNYERTYACYLGTTGDCDQKLAEGCHYSGPAECQDNPPNPEGVCTMETRPLKCPVPAAPTAQSGACGSVTCIGSSCFTDTRPQNAGLSQVATAIEAAHQAATYYKDGKIFSGVGDRCNFWPFTNCCQSASSSSDGVTALKYGMAINVGAGLLKEGGVGLSQASYNFLMGTDASWMPSAMFSTYGKGLQSLSDMSAGGSAFSAGSVFGALGTAIPGLSIGSAAPSYMGLSSYLGASGEALFTAPIGAGVPVYFNPVTLYAAIAVYVINELFSCSQEDKMHAMRAGSNLCKEIGPYCSNRIRVLFASICIEKKRSFCCYNSVLAKEVNIAAANQFARGWGSPESPNCSGITFQELEQLDWSKVDLTEFTAQVMSSMTQPDPGDVNRVTDMIKNQTLPAKGVDMTAPK